MAKRQRVQDTTQGTARHSDSPSHPGRIRTRRFLAVVWTASVTAVGAVITAGIIGWWSNRTDTRKTPAGGDPRVPSHLTNAFVPLSALDDATGKTATTPRAVAEALEKEALGAIRQLITTLPESPDPLALMGTVQVQFGHTDEGVRWWERCLEIDPNRCDVCDGLAQIAEAKGEYDKARQLWGKVLQVNPGLPGIRNKLAGVLIDSGRMDEALAVLKGELELPNGEKHLAHHLLGKAYLQLRKHDEARECYEASVAIRPDYASAWFGLATVQARLGRPEQSRRSMEKYRGLLDETGESRTGRAAGRDSDRSRERSQRELTAVRLLAALAHTGVGAVYRARGYPDRAMPHWKRAGELDPGDTQCRMELAAFYRDGGERDKAAAVFEQLLKIDSSNALFHSNLGVLYAEMNRLDAALAALQRAIELDPNSQVSRRVYRQVREMKQRER